MKRAGFRDLQLWADDPARHPLVIRGARQVGKTWLVEEFARSRFGDVATLDFERDPKAASLFEAPSPLDNLRAVEAYLGKRLQPGASLLFLDEVQAAPRVLARLRYFFEEVPLLHVVAAGSLLDFALADAEFRVPVGRISYFHLEPVSFSEFLVAMDRSTLLDVVKQWHPDDSIPAAVHDELLRQLRDYVITGGMPAAVEAFRKSGSFVVVSRLQQDLLSACRDDFARYGSRATAQRLHRVLDSVPLQVGRKFKYAQVDREDRSAPLKQSLDQLCMARVCHRVRCSHANGIPLAAELDLRAFKVLMLDTGLMLAAQRLLPDQILSSDLAVVNSGAVAEQLVGQMLRTLGPSHIEPELYYWRRERKGSEAEIDYLLQHAGGVVPLEVKAGSSGRLRSLHTFMAEKGLAHAVRVHSQTPELRNLEARTSDSSIHEFQLLSLPFYMVEEIPRLLDEM